MPSSQAGIEPGTNVLWASDSPTLPLQVTKNGEDVLLLVSLCLNGDQQLVFLQLSPDQSLTSFQAHYIVSFMLPQVS